jgi:hypothetical protein
LAKHLVPEVREASGFTGTDVSAQRTEALGLLQERKYQVLGRH